MNQDNQGDLDPIVQILRGGGIWVILTIFIIAILGFKTFRMGEVTGEQVGVVLDKMTGEMKVIEASGVHIYNSITNEFFILDRTLQTISMTEALGRGNRRNKKDDLKVKTIDGSDVYVDLQVDYEIIASMADTVIRTSGPGDAFMHKWVRDYVRSISRNSLGELTTEEFYDSSLRNSKVNKAKKEVNDKIKNFGIRITDIRIPQRPHFYKAYEDMIKKKKLADQEELQEISQANAARQKQKTQIQIAENNKQVELARAKGEKEQQVIRARADGERRKAEAKAYAQKIKVGADASLYRMSKEATGILAKKKAEAEGIEELKRALEGEGGRNMVKMEYAKRLKNVTISGTPITKESHIGRFELKNNISGK